MISYKIKVALFLSLAAAWFIAGIVLMNGVEAYQAAAWMLFYSSISCSLAYTSLIPRLHRNTVVIVVGFCFVLCTILAACGFAAGLATKTMDRVAFGVGLFTTLVGIPLTALWTKSGFPLKTTDLQVKDDGPAIGTSEGRGGCCETKACTWCVNFVWILVVILVVLFTAEVLGEVADTRMYLPPASEFVDVQATTSTFNSALTGTTGRDDPHIKVGHLRHMVCKGTGSPLVVLEHGRGGSIWDWAWVQEFIADHPNGTTVCAFSRPGYGFSTRGDFPRSAAQTSLELKEALIDLGLDVPFIHAGHSWGGLALRMYQKMYPDQILAQVFVDAVHAPCFEICDANTPAPSTFYKVIAALAGAGLPRALAATRSLPLNGSVLVELLPKDVQGPRLAAINSPQYWQTWVYEQEELSLSCDQVKRLATSNITTLKVPIRNVMAGQGIHLEEDGNYTCGATLADLSFPAGTSVIVPGAPHIELLFDLQYATSVAAQILDVLQEVRAVS